MTILIACEVSGKVRRAFQQRGHKAYSCDLSPADDGETQFHYRLDARKLLHLKWDLLIAFPPCTHLCVSGAKHFKAKQISGEQRQGIDFFMLFTQLSHIPKVAIENPIGIMSTIYRPPDQVIQPWQFGDAEVKSTCLWLKGLSPLKPTFIMEGRTPRIHNLPPSEDRAKLRSETYHGIAQAMAEQWG